MIAGRHTRRRARVVWWLAPLLVALLAPPPVATARLTRSGASVAEDLRFGRSLRLANATIVGTITLDPGTVVRGPLVCSQCVLRGSLQVSGVTFDAPIKFVGGHVTGDFDAVGAQFRDVLALRQASIDGQARLDGATLRRGAVIDHTQFHQTVDLSSAAFGGPASFACSGFSGALIVDHATFAGAAVFAARPKGTDNTCASDFRQSANFAGANFRREADFTRRSFHGPVSFTNSAFRGHTDFANASFAEDADFTAATFQRDTTFANAAFGKTAGFDSVAVVGLIDLASANLHGKTASFTRATGSGTISLQGASLANNGALLLKGTSQPKVLADVSSVAHVPAPGRETALRLVESSATASGDVGLANDARYQRLTDRHNTLTGLRKTFDGLVYRDAAGYLVRPKRPTLVLLVLVALGGLLRWFPKLRDEGRDLVKRVKAWHGGPGRIPRTIDRLRFYTVKLERMLGALPGGVLKALGVAARPTPDISLEDSRSPDAYLKTTLQWLEYLGQKFLIGALVVGVLSHNEATRKFLEALGF